MANLFTSQTPASGNNSDGTPGITTATAVRFSSSGSVTGIRFYATTTVGGTYTGALYQVTAADPNGSGGTLLASKTLGVTPTAGTWNTITFDTPVSVDNTHLYKVALFSGDGRYVLTTSFFTADLVNGLITSDANGDDPVGLGNLNNGSFTINASLAYPTGGGGSCYFVDVEFTTGDASISLGDTGSSAEALTVSVTASLADAGAGVDSSSAPASAPLADTGAASEAASASATAPLAETGLAADALDNGQSTPIALADDALAVDLLVVAKSGHAGGGSWWTLASILGEQRENEAAERERQARPAACPYDGEPMKTGPRGELYCPFDGYVVR